MDIVSKIKGMDLASSFSQLKRFALSGVLGTGVHYALLITLVELSLMKAVYATALGFLGGAITNYWLAKIYVYQSQENTLRSMFKFFLMAMLGIVVNQTLFSVLVLWVHYIVAQLIVTLCVFILNFLISKFWVFKA